MGKNRNPQNLDPIFQGLDTGLKGFAALVHMNRGQFCPLHNPGLGASDGGRNIMKFKIEEVIDAGRVGQELQKSGAFSHKELQPDLKKSNLVF